MASSKPKTKRGKKQKVHKVLTEFKEGTLHSGSASGPKVTSQKQAIAIALSEAGMSKRKGKSRRRAKRGATVVMAR